MMPCPNNFIGTNEEVGGAANKEVGVPMMEKKDQEERHHLKRRRGLRKEQIQDSLATLRGSLTTSKYSN